MQSFRLNDRVRAVIGQRLTLHNGKSHLRQLPGDMAGTVVQITGVAGREGDSIHVRWDNGYTGRVRQYRLMLDEEAP